MDATPAKPGRVADTAAPSRRLATHRRAVFVVARKRKHIYENVCALRRCRQFAVFCINRSVHPGREMRLIWARRFCYNVHVALRGGRNHRDARAISGLEKIGFKCVSGTKHRKLDYADTKEMS